MMTTSYDGGSYRSPDFLAPLPGVAIKPAMSGCDFLSRVKKQLRRDYSEALETSLPDDLATLIGQLDEAP